MKKNNNYGFTVVELIITFAIAIPILIGLYKIVDAYRESQIKIGYEKDIISYKNEIISAVESDLITLKLNEIKYNKNVCTDSGNGITMLSAIEFNFDKVNKHLCVYSVKEGIDYIKYGDQSEEIKYAVPNKFVSFQNDLFYDHTNTVIASKMLNANEVYYLIDIKLKHSEISKIFDINIVAVKRDDSKDNIKKIKFDTESLDILNEIKNSSDPSSQKGKLLTIGNEKFKILDIRDNKIIAFSENNILVGRDSSGKYSNNGGFIPKNIKEYGLQFTFSEGLGTIEYYDRICDFDLSKTLHGRIGIDISKALIEGNQNVYDELWIGIEGNPREEEKNKSVEEYKKVYKSNSKIWDYLKYYQDYLNNNEGGYNVTTRLPVYDDIKNTNYNTSSYWLGTASATLINAIKKDTDILVGAACNMNNLFGVRPIVEIDL